MKNQKFHRIGEVARLVGVHPNTIRNLERRGLLHPARDWAGQRRFTEKDATTLRALLESPLRGKVGQT
jgi:DNA-binding transcriptional MerR regulator